MSWDSQKQPQKGILRAPRQARRYQRSELTLISSEKEEELLVFGYACKIFPPDGHARDIAKGRHLIPWNGDENLQLLIDRYDARASLHDLSEFNQDSWNTLYEMSEEESRIEQLCDQERYMAMYTDIADERLRHEEELKRLHASISGDDSSFKEVGFNYDSTEPVQTDVASATASTEQPTIEDAEEDQEEKPFMAPASLAIPPNMEIPPTEKMHAIVEKTATFVSGQGAQMEIILKAKQAKNSQFLFLDFDHYLNPYYKHVLKRIKEGKYRPGVKQPKPEEEEDEESDSDDEGGYLHPSLFASSRKVKEEEEERKKENMKAIQKVDPNHPLAKLIERGRKANALKQYNIMKTTVLNFNPGTEDALEPPPLPRFMESAQNSSNPSSPLTLQDQDALPPRITPQEAAMVIVPPPPDIQPMVDSVAKQIAEEGDAAEQSMREKKDPLLAFLEPSHELHPYYTFRKTFTREQLKAQKRLLQQIQAQEAKEALEAEDKQSGPICFSIKGKKESVPKTTLISTRLQALGGDSDEDEEEKGEGANKSENKENEKDGGDSSKSSENSKPATKRKFVEITVVEGIAKPSEQKATPPPPPSTMTEEDRKRLLAQTKRKFTDAPPPNVVVTPDTLAPSISSFTVVTPDGNTMSIAEFREKQAERRQKASLMALQKAKESADTIKAEAAQQKNIVSQDIFDMFEEEESKSDIKKTPDTLETSCTKENSASSRIPASSREPTPPPKSPSLEPVPSAPPAMTLKDLVVAASRPSPPKDGKHRRSQSKSHEKSRSPSRSKQSSPFGHSRKRKTRSRSRERDYAPSVHKRILGSSSYRAPSTGRSRYKEDENLPSAYKIENRPTAYSNGNYSRLRRREPSPTRDRSRKRHHFDSDKDDERKKRRSHSSPSRKSKKHSKAKKKHKKKKSKTKKKKNKNTSSEEGEWSSDSESSSRNAEKRVKIKEGSVDNASSPNKLPRVEKEDGELTPQQSNDVVKS